MLFRDVDFDIQLRYNTKSNPDFIDRDRKSNTTLGRIAYTCFISSYVIQFIVKAIKAIRKLQRPRLLQDMLHPLTTLVSYFKTSELYVN